MTADDIAQVVSRATGIPVETMMESERAKLLRMEDELKVRVARRALRREYLAQTIQSQRSDDLLDSLHSSMPFASGELSAKTMPWLP